MFCMQESKWLKSNNLMVDVVFILRVNHSSCQQVWYVIDNNNARNHIISIFTHDFCTLSCVLIPLKLWKFNVMLTLLSWPLIHSWFSKDSVFLLPLSGLVFYHLFSGLFKVNYAYIYLWCHLDFIQAKTCFIYSNL